SLVRIRYFGCEAALELSGDGGGGCLLTVTCDCGDREAWLEFYPGWVSWLLVLKGAVDFGVDLRNGAADRSWSRGFVDQCRSRLTAGRAPSPPAATGRAGRRRRQVAPPSTARARTRDRTLPWRSGARDRVRARRGVRLPRRCRRPGRGS